MSIEDNLPKNKNINSLERKEAKHPLLQLLYNNKKKDDHNKIDYIHSSNFKNKRRSISYSDKIDPINITPKKNVINNNKNEKYKLEDYKIDENNNLFSSVYSNSDCSDDIKNKNSQFNNIQNIKKINLSKSTAYNKRKSMSLLANNNIIFPNLTQNKNLFNLIKKTKDENFIDKHIESDLMEKNINFNNNSIFISEPRPFMYFNTQKFFGDKVLCQKSIEFSLLTNKSHKNSSKNMTLKETYLNNSPDFQIYSDKSKIRDILLTPEKKSQNNSNKIIQSNKNNNLISKFTTENNELNNNFKRRKSINLPNKLILYGKDKNNPFNMDKSKDFDKRKSFISIIPRKNNNQNSKFQVNPFDLKTSNLSQRAKSKINIKRITNKKKFKLKNEKKEINNKSINRILSPIKTDIQKFINNMNINNEVDEYSKHFISKKDISNNPLAKFYNNSINNLNKSNKNYFFKNTPFTDNDHMESDDNIIVIQNSMRYYDLNSIFTKKLINENEEDYFNKKRAKIFEKVEKSNKESDLYNSYNSEIKNYLLKNYAIDKITERIFENFEPLENRIENKKETEEKQKKILKEILQEILNKSHYYSMNDIFKLNISILKQKKIHKKVKIVNHYILEMFDIYPNLIKQFHIKWNNKRRKEYYYKKMIEIFSSRNEISNAKVNKRNYLALDKDYFIYKERIYNEINIDLNINSLHLKINIENEKRDGLACDSSRKRLSTIKYKNNLASKYDSKNQILSFFAQNNIDKNETNNIQKKLTQEVALNKKIGNYVKIQKELGLSQHNQNFEKFAKLYRISQKNLITIPNIKNNENEDKKIYNFNTEKESLFNTAKANLDNYNILKNRKIFHYSSSKQINIEKKFFELFKNQRNKIQLDKKNKIDNITIKFAGMDQLTKEAATIKTQEIERDLPDSKLFDKFVLAIQERNINQFNILLQKKEQSFGRIINKQELNTGNTLLIYSTQYNFKSLVEFLLLKGADPNIQNNFGNTALHIAFKNDNVFIINLLLEHNADQKIKNNNDLLPWQMSRSLNN